MLIPSSERLLVLDVPADAALNGLDASLCQAICLGVVGGGTAVVNEVAHHAGMKLSLELSAAISE